MTSLSTYAPDTRRSVSYTEIYKNVRKWVAKGSGLGSNRVFETYQEGDDPKDAFATVVSVGKEIQGIPGYTSARNKDDIQWRNLQIIYHDTLRIEWFRDGSSERADLFEAWIYTNESLEMADSNGFRLLQVANAVRNDNLKSDNSWEERVQLDLMIGYIYYRQEVADVAVSVSGFTAGMDADRSIEGGRIVEGSTGAIPRATE